MTTMSDQGSAVRLSEHELSEIRMLIQERTGICFDESRERFFSTHVREHIAAKKLGGGTELLRLMRKTNVEYEALAQFRAAKQAAGALEESERQPVPVGAAR